jgi:hypothetical protein
MKNFYFILLLAVGIISFSGCVKKEMVVPSTTITADILPSDWTYSTSTQTYYVQLNMPEINGYANDNYGILVSASFGDDLYEAIPEVYDGNSYSFTHQVGLLTLEVQGANGATVAPPTKTMHVKIVIIPSAQ